MAAPAAPATPRPSASAAHDLKTLVLSRHPAIVVESPEEERIDALARAVAADLRLPLYEWTVKRGLLPVGATTVATAGIYGSEDPLKGLADMAGARARGNDGALRGPRAGARGVPASDRGGRRAAGDQRARAGKPRAGRVRRAGGRRVGAHPHQARQAVAHAALEDGLLELFPPADNPSELGGFGRLKAWLERARVGYGAEARAIGLEPPRGLLLVGVQGCGKSLSAKFIAREWRLPLLKLDAGRLYDKYVGESERNFRRATGLAESMAPCVLWIDEIEEGLSPAGGDADSGLSRRLFGSFLTWLQDKRADVFVVATANDLSLLPPELLRKGRFDETFFVDLPTAEERETILRIHLGLRRQDATGFDLGRLATASEGFSGAELEQAVVSALYGALAERRALDTDAVQRELEATVPLSVTRREDIEQLRTMARTRFVPVA